MNDSSSLANALSEPLRQPFWWAALASVTLHGVFGVNAPKISNLIYGGNSSKNLPGSVGFVELTPTEMGRLPQTIPAVGKNGKLPGSIAPVPLLRNLTPPLPPASSPINLPALPPGMPPPGFFSPLPPSPLPSLTPPTPPTTSTPTVVKTPTVKIPLAIPPQPPANQFLPPSDNFGSNAPPPPPSPSPELPRFLPGGADEYDPAKLQLKIDQAAVPGVTKIDIATPKDFQPGGRYSSEPDLGQQNLTPKTPEQIAQENFDRNNQAFQRGQSSDRSSDQNNQKQNERNGYLNVFQQLQVPYPNLLPIKETVVVNPPYPPAACAEKLTGIAMFGAVVDDKGDVKTLSERTRISSVGSPILDNAAKDATAPDSIIKSGIKFTPANPNTYKFYQLAISFKYDEKVCSGTSVKASPAPTGPKPTLPQLTLPSPVPRLLSPVVQPSSSPAPTAQPKPRTQQSPSPQPKPGAKQSPSPQPQPGARDLMLEPQPAAEESPTLQPQPAVEESPTPQPAVSPTTESSPSPSPTASPVAAPSPTTEPSPTASPSPAVSP